MLPIETVVGLLMCFHKSDLSVSSGDEYFLCLSVEQTLYGRTKEELRSSIRTYLKSLVPAPKLLSECEEGMCFTGRYTPGIAIMRDGEFAYEADGTCGGLAKDFTVVQPVEVNRE